MATAFAPAALVRRIPAAARPALWSWAVPAPTACTQASDGASAATSNGRSMATTPCARANRARWASVSSGTSERASAMPAGCPRNVRRCWPSSYGSTTTSMRGSTASIAAIAAATASSSPSQSVG